MPTQVDTVKILILVEDEADMRMVIRALISRDPRIEIVGEAANAVDAIELARTVEPGLVILDHQLDGDIMGVSAAPMIKAVAPMAKILLFSAFDMREEVAREPAIDEFLSKSRVGQLLPTVQRMLDLR